MRQPVSSMHSRCSARSGPSPGSMPPPGSWNSRCRRHLLGDQHVVALADHGVGAGPLDIAAVGVDRVAVASHRRQSRHACRERPVPVCTRRRERLFQGEQPRETFMSLAGRIAWDDTVLPFQLDRADIRGRVGRLDQVLETILGQHDYPAPVAALVAEAALITALIGQTIKLRWKLSLQIRGDGPVRLIATDYFGPSEEGQPARMRAWAGFDAEALPGRGGAAVRPPRQGGLRDPDRPGAGHHALPGHDADRRRLARRLRRDLLRPVRAAADPLRAGDGRGAGARRRGALARRRRAAPAHAEGVALCAGRRPPASTACSPPRTCSRAPTPTTGAGR